MAKTLTLKNMVETYFNSNADQEVWRAFYTLHCAGMIDRDTWCKFFDKCHGWYYIDGVVCDMGFDMDGVTHDKPVTLHRGH